MASIKEIIEKAENVKPIAEKNGTKIVSFEDAIALNDKEGIEPTAKDGIRTYNPDGSLARIRSNVSAINPKSYFANRYKKVAKKLKVVVDWRAISEQDSGKIYLKSVPVYVIARDENEKLFVEKVETVSDTDFCSDYTNTLNEDAMIQIAPLIADYGSDVTPSSLPI